MMTKSGLKGTSQVVHKADRIGVLVLGMHRSGTSALTRVLSFLGADLPHNVMAPSEGNEQGHWESNEAVVFNQAILASAGSEWDDWLPFNPGWYDSPIKQDFVTRAVAMLEKEFGQSRLFVLKDPRICRFLPVWLEAMEKAGVSTVAAIPLRNPIEVARSLQARDGIDVEYGLLMWLRHALDGEFYTRDYPRSFSTFSQLLDDWKKVALRAEADFGLHWPRFSTQTAADVAGFLTPAHRHQRVDESGLGRSLVMPDWVRETYSILTSWAEHGENQKDYARLDAIRQQFDVASPSFVGLVSQQLRRAEEVGAAERERKQLAVSLQDAEGRLAELTIELEQLREAATQSGEIDSLQQQVAQLQQERDGLTYAVADKETIIASLQAQRGELSSEIEVLDHSLQESIKIADDALESEKSLRQYFEGNEQKLLDIIKEYQAIADSSSNDLEDARRIAREMEQAFHNAVTQSEYIQNALASTQAELSSSRDNAAALDAQISALSARLHLEESRLRQKEEELQQALAGLESERQLSKEARSEAVKLLSTNEGLVGQIGVMAEQVMQMSRELRDAEMQVRQSADDLARERRILEEREHDHRQERRKAMLADLALKAVKAEVDDAKRQLQQQTDELLALTKLLQAADARATDAERELNGFKNGQALSGASAIQMQEAHLALQAEAEQLRAEIATVQFENQGLRRDLAALSAEVERSVQTQEDMKATKAELQAREQDLQQLRGEVGKLRQEVGARFGEVATLSAELGQQADVAQRSTEQLNWLRSVNRVVNEGQLWWWRFMPVAWQRRKVLERLEGKGLFNADAYLSRYPDVARVGMDPLRHYILHGMPEGRQV